MRGEVTGAAGPAPADLRGAQVGIGKDRTNDVVGSGDTTVSRARCELERERTVGLFADCLDQRRPLLEV
jgi:hypothetical protein